MRKITILFLLLSLAAMSQAQQRTVERTYVSTDKDSYVAGERIWCSAFCVEPSGKLSQVSRVAYLELHSADGMAATARIALEGGRGAGAVELPLTLPTGNYRLIAYTSQNKAEKGYDYEGLASKTLSIFNVLSNERVAGGVEVVEPGEYTEMAYAKTGMQGESADLAHVDLHWENGRLVLANNTGEDLTLSLSVHHDDGILSNGNPDIAGFLSENRLVGPKQFDNGILPDYEGEIIRGRVVGFSEEMIPQLTGKYAFISSPSDKSDVYAAPVAEDGSLTFYTANIYGSKECICEIEDIDPKLSCHVELFSPYVNAKVAAPAPLPISSSVSEALKLRSVGMQLERSFNADTLYEFIPRRSDGLFDENVVVRYILDDYTRFTTMEEVFIEFIPELRVRKTPEGGRQIRVRLSEMASNPMFSTGKTLMMLDGVPVFNQEKILAYDPLLLESIDIYPHTHFIGNRIFEGVVNFVSYKRNLPSFQFDGNARVIDYQGVCVPMAVTGSGIDSGYPDYRQTIYWHPMLSVDAGKNLEAECKLPLYKGRFEAVAEGITASGKPVCSRIYFEVR